MKPVSWESKRGNIPVIANFNSKILQKEQRGVLLSKVFEYPDTPDQWDKPVIKLTGKTLSSC